MRLKHYGVKITEGLKHVRHPIKITDQKENVLKNKNIPLAKMMWKGHRVDKATRELESKL